MWSSVESLCKVQEKVAREDFYPVHCSQKTYLMCCIILLVCPKYFCHSKEWKVRLHVFFSEAYEVLLSSNDIGYKSSMHFTTNLPWATVLKKICFFGHFNGKMLLIL